MFGWFRKYVRKIGLFGVEVEFHPPHEVATPSPAAQRATPGKGGHAGADATRAKPGSERGGLPPDGGEGLTFDAVIQAIHEWHPEAVLGRTAEQGEYFERARRLTNYRMHAADPPCYGAVQPNGKTMWLYLGKGGKICCGDKE